MYCGNATRNSVAYIPEMSVAHIWKLKWVWLPVCSDYHITVPSYLPGKTDHMHDIPGHWVDVWRSGTLPQNHKWVSALPIATWTVEWLSAQHQIVLTTFLGFRSHFRAIQMECATSPHVHPMSNDTAHDQFYLAFPCISTVTNKHWDEKAWVWGYITVH